MIQSLNPANGQVLRRFDALPAAAVEAKLALADATAKTYRAESMDHRRFWMRRLALLLESDREDLATIIVTEVGKPIVAARLEVDKCASVCRYYAEHAERILESETVATEHAQSYVRWDPLGVVLAIMPWNFPLWQVFRFLAPALMAGNVALLKHAPSVPQCALAIETIVRRAGFPRGSLQSLLMESKDVESVLGDERVAAVTVTGSEAAGRAVAAQAGYLLKKSVLELGGSDPYIVMPSADLPTAIANGVEARCINNGQSCIAAKRFIVHEAVYDEFERGFVADMKGLKIGDPMLDDTELGPLASAEARERLLGQIDAAIAAGGRVLTGGKAIDRDGFYVEPTVIADVSRASSVYNEEIFGPVALLFRVGSLHEAIEVANDTPFGLGASCWTTSVEEQEQLARDIQAGAVFFNTPVASDPRLPFGGVKRSGYGRELSAAGMREFLNAKTVVVAEAKDAPQQTDFEFAAEDSLAETATAEPASESPAVQEPALAAKEPEKIVARHSGSTLGLTS